MSHSFPPCLLPALAMQTRLAEWLVLASRQLPRTNRESLVMFEGEKFLDQMVLIGIFFRSLVFVLVGQKLVQMTMAFFMVLTI